MSSRFAGIVDSLVFIATETSEEGPLNGLVGDLSALLALRVETLGGFPNPGLDGLFDRNWGGLESDFGFERLCGLDNNE